ncbi:MAG: hypothetical protein AAB531_03370 [Patescibacteria group bacterium]
MGPSEPEDNKQINQSKSLKKLLIAVFVFLVFLLLATFLFNLNNQGKKSKSIEQAKNTSANNPNLAKINKIISEIKNTPQDSVKNVNPPVWQIQKESILIGSGGKNKDFPGLNDVRDAIKNRQNSLAKELMTKGIFLRIASPLPTIDGKREIYKKLSKEEMQGYDPQNVFFDKEAVSALISEARFKQAIEFIKLYYSL